MNPLEGGIDDEYAPIIDSAHTFPLPGQLNFSGQEVRIKFNEYVKLVKPRDNIIISPSGNQTEITAKNKTVKIQFGNALDPNTTYSINFNRAVADLNEGNDSIFQYVFSTGDYIDSMVLTGSVTDGFTNRPDKNFLVALYPDSLLEDFDSIPRLVTPTYIGQTDESGKFRLNYLKNNAYFLFAFSDVNKNLKLDPGERIAYPEDRVVALETENAHSDIKSFKPKSADCQITETRFSWPGKLEFIFSNDPVNFDVWSTLPLLRDSSDKVDSLVYWLSGNPTSGMQFFTKLNGVLDTIKPFYKGIPEAGTKIPELTFQTNIRDGKLLPGENLRLIFSEPVGSVPEEKIHFIDSDSNSMSLTSKMITPRIFEFPTSSGNVRNFVLDSLGVTSLFGKQNNQRTEKKFENHAIDYYGTVTILLDSVVQENMLVELIDMKGKVVVDSIQYGKSMKFTRLEPLAYQLRLIFDENADGRWTSGDFSEGSIPERVIYFSGEIKAKSKWEKEIEWNIKYN